MKTSSIWFLVCWMLYPLARLGWRRPYLAALRRHTHAVLRDGGRRGRRLPPFDAPAWP